MESIRDVLKRVRIPIERCPACGATGCQVDPNLTVLDCRGAGPGVTAVIVNGRRLVVRRAAELG